MNRLDRSASQDTIFKQMQRAYESRMPREDEDPIEPTDDQRDEARESIGKDMSTLSTILMESPWFDEHAAYLFDNCPKFKAEVFDSAFVEREALRIAVADRESDALEGAMDAYERRMDR